MTPDVDVTTCPSLIAVSTTCQSPLHCDVDRCSAAVFTSTQLVKYSRRLAWQTARLTDTDIIRNNIHRRLLVSSVNHRTHATVTTRNANLLGS